MPSVITAVAPAETPDVATPASPQCSGGFDRRRANFRGNRWLSLSKPPLHPDDCRAATTGFRAANLNYFKVPHG
jgi:hypothetical protein